MDIQELTRVVHQCAKTGTLRQGMTLHALVTKSTPLLTFLCNHLLNMYSKLNNNSNLPLSQAHQLFDQMPDPNLISWSTLISAYSHSLNPSTSLSLFSNLPFTPNEYVYGATLGASARLLDAQFGRQIHAHAIKLSYEKNTIVSASLVSLYMKCGMFDHGMRAFGDSQEPQVSAWNAVISGCIDKAKCEVGLELFSEMRTQGVMPDRFTLVGVLSICAGAHEWSWWCAHQLHCLSTKLGLASLAFVANSILTLYSKCGSSLEEVELLFDEIDAKDTISWNTFMASCSHFGDHNKALNVLAKMATTSLVPDAFTFSSVLAACTGLASLELGSMVHARALRTMSNPPDTALCNALVTMYARCGRIDRACIVFELIPLRNVVSWNALIAGLACHGLGLKAISTFEAMRNDLKAPSPDSVTFVALLTGCSHTGLVEEGKVYFEMMVEDYGIEPSIEHFSCLIDMLGRAGLVSEGEEYAKRFGGEDLVIWGSLLSACRLHGDLETGKRVGSSILEMGPDIGSPYVLVSNMFARERMWEEVRETRKRMRESGVKKEVGWSWVQVRGEFHRFTVGDFDNPYMRELMNVLGSFEPYWFSETRVL
ncbi:hypothetical protein AMTRI_Chr04g251820 [Amborella trichopoda]